MDASSRSGHWHSLVYLTLPKTRRFLQLAKRRIGNLRCSEILVKEAHLSLSRPFWLWQHEIKSFITKLRLAIHSRCVHPFELCILDQDLVRLPSDDGRTFLALCVQESAVLRSLVSAVDQALLDFGRSPYFEDPIFHVSVAVLAEDDKREQGPPTKRQRFSGEGEDAFEYSSSDESSEDAVGSSSSNIFISASSVQCKCGHLYYGIELRGAQGDSSIL
mmetsp:Transcript_22444/g.29095  ORF Transcript_22444/g.29095 Transcript_22444/m.29095 type:complete len:218 (-) Transcript_22444:123-776(-)